MKEQYAKQPTEMAMDFVFVVSAACGNEERIEHIRRMVKVFSGSVVEKIGDYLRSRGRKPTDVRGRLIVYGAKDERGEAQISESGFYRLPQQYDGFMAQLDRIGACPQPEKADEAFCGLTAFQRATESPWCIGDGKVKRCRHYIVMFVGEAEESPSDKQMMPACEAKWEQMNGLAKRLLLYSAEGKVWDEIMQWQNVMGRCIDWTRIAPEQLAKETILSML